MKQTKLQQTKNMQDVKNKIKMVCYSLENEGCFPKEDSLFLFCFLATPLRSIVILVSFRPYFH